MAAESSDDGLTYSGHLPVVWEPFSRWPDSAALARDNANNIQVLNAVAALEASPVEPDEDDGAIGLAIRRLDMKINLVLDLVGKLVSERAELPPPSPVSLGSATLSWTDPGASFAVGDVGVATVYLRASLATPLRLAGRIESVEQRDGGPWFKLHYSDLDEPVRDALEKLIFRRHRRAIAHRHPCD